jgi:cell division septum initiation protein DivIVA
MTTTTALKIVDQLGLIEDQIEALQEQAEDLKNQLKMLGQGSYAGTMYVTTIKHTPEKKSTAWAAVAKELSAPAELIAKHTKVTYNILAAETKALSN